MPRYRVEEIIGAMAITQKILPVLKLRNEQAIRRGGLDNLLNPALAEIDAIQARIARAERAAKELQELLK